MSFRNTILRESSLKYDILKIEMVLSQTVNYRCLDKIAQVGRYRSNHLPLLVDEMALLIWTKWHVRIIYLSFLRMIEFVRYY